MRRFSIRTRVTLGSVAVATVLLVVALLIVRAQVDATLTNADTSLARNDLASFASDITDHPDAEVDDPGTGVLVYVRDPNGNVQVNTLPHDVFAAIATRPGATEVFDFTDDEQRSFAVAGEVVPTTTGDWTLWSARSTSSSALALEGLDHVLVVGGVALLVGFGFASWLLSTAALRPVTRMRQRAESLGSDLIGDLPVSEAHDELAALATTLNEFLERTRSSRAREQRMVSDAAHELRTPLAALRTQLELAHGDFGDAQALGAQIIDAEVSVRRLSALANNLLELARLESDARPDVVCSSEEAFTEFLAAVDRVRGMAVSRNIDVQFVLAPSDIPHNYRIDAMAFGRVIDNLCTNAIAAVADAGIITATLTETNAGLVLTVDDDGPGMPAEFVPVAFERFSRADTSRTHGTGGSGLGLSLVQAITRDAGGDAEVRNRGTGLRVTVTIPNM